MPQGRVKRSSQLTEEQVTGLLHRKGLHAYTHATLVSPVHLKEDLALTRKRGYSFDDEEHALGLRCIAACILTSTASRLPPSLFPGRFRV